jgi:hypothetical protein
MSTKEIYFDQTEIVLTIEGKNKVTTLNVTYDQIVHIKFDPCMERKFFRKIPSEKIEIMVKKRQLPIIYTKLKSKKYFEEYKNELEKFSINNRITFFNNLTNEAKER